MKIAVDILQALLLILGAPLVRGIIARLKARLQRRQGASIWRPYADLCQASPQGRSCASDLIGGVSSCADCVVWIDDVRGGLCAVAYAFGAARVARRFLLASSTCWRWGGSSFRSVRSTGAARSAAWVRAARHWFQVWRKLRSCWAFVAVAILASHADIAGMVAWTLQQNIFNISAVHILAFTSLAMVVLAETGRMPVDNPTTHLELTMIHEGMVLEYSGPSLALIEWASAIKLHAMLALLIALFGPWGMASGGFGWGIAVALAAVLCQNRGRSWCCWRDREWNGQTADVSCSGLPGSCFRSERAGGDLYDAGQEVAKWVW